MKKYLTILLSTICCLVLSSCSTSAKEQEMPEIVFLYKSTFRSKDEYKIWFIDKQGNIYYSTDAQVVGSPFPERVEQFAAGEYDGKISLVGTVEISELEGYYKQFNKLTKNKEFELVFPGWGVNEECPWQRWYGFYYDSNEELKWLLFSEEDSSEYIPNDTNALEIAEWMSELMKETMPKE